MRYFVQSGHLQPGAESRHWLHPLFTAHSSVEHVWGVFPVPGQGVQTGAWQAGQLPNWRVPWVLGSFQEGFSACLGGGGCPGKGLKGAGGVFTGWGWKGGRPGEEDQPLPSPERAGRIGERAERARGGFRAWQSGSRCCGAVRGGAHLGGTCGTVACLSVPGALCPGPWWSPKEPRREYGAWRLFPALTSLG